MRVMQTTVFVYEGEAYTSEEECPAGSVTLHVDASGANVISWASHSCPEVNLGTITLTGDFARVGGVPDLAFNRVQASGTIGSSQFSGVSIPWSGSFDDLDANGVVEQFTVVRSGVVAVTPGLGEVSLLVDITATRAGDLP
jgi:hypothetical protein